MPVIRELELCYRNAMEKTKRLLPMPQGPYQKRKGTIYSTTRKELLALVWSMEHFASYLIGKPFKARSDHITIGG